MAPMIGSHVLLILDGGLPPVFILAMHPSFSTSIKWLWTLPIPNGLDTALLLAVYINSLKLLPNLP